ncbi:Metallo-hydrolase/oxidoreductase [Panus rudis PR-1116 ss-1]|nr:Metallo-hydrolase/oxidoreductase [Panus rudis PR-1116 ss-1]
MSSSHKKAAFKATLLSSSSTPNHTSSTFLITEHSDIYDEHPFIYAKLVPEANTILLIDTGCGGATDKPEIEITSLREFMEVVPIEENGGKPLNDGSREGKGGKMGYVVVLSHCHYDHILGVEQFASDSAIYASAHDPTFLSPTNLPKHSLCKDMGISTPQYTPVLLPDNHELAIGGVSLGMRVLHTPGHTPDEVALWDEEEGMLYVGDTLYEWAPIIFPNEGSIVTWFRSVDSLVRLVSEHSRHSGLRIRISCGHVTAGQDALDVLRKTREFMVDVVKGKEKVRERFEKRGEVCVQYVQEGMRFSLVCPERLVKEAQTEQDVLLA